jgi:hypothetical protein
MNVLVGTMFLVQVLISMLCALGQNYFNTQYLQEMWYVTAPMWVPNLLVTYQTGPWPELLPALHNFIVFPLTCALLKLVNVAMKGCILLFEQRW